MTTDLPATVRLAWWATSWLRGRTVPDLLVDAVVGDDATHVVVGLPGLVGTAALVEALGAMRRLGADAVGAALPVEGDPLGVGGPRELNAAAIEAGEAVVVSGIGWGLVPSRTGAAVVWTAHPAERRQLPDVGEADRGLRAALLEAAEALARLDVARWRPEVADRLMDLRHGQPLEAPPGVPARCVELAARGLQAREIVALALADDGAAVSAVEAQRRRDALVPLDRAARRALVAAASPEVWPPA